MSREQFWFFHPFRVRYSEIDGQGVVFNAHYLTYFDTTITEYFRALGYDQYADAKADRRGFPRRQIGDRIQGAGPCSTGNWTSARAWRGSATSSLTLRTRHLPEGRHRRARDRRDRLGQHQPADPSSGPDIEGDPGADRGAGEASRSMRLLGCRIRAHPRHCLRQTRSVCARVRSDEAIHLSPGGGMDCSLLLAMTGRELRHCRACERGVSQPQSNFAVAVLPSGAVNWTAPFGLAGSAVAAVPLSTFFSEGASVMRSTLPSTLRMATPLNPWDRPACRHGPAGRFRSPYPLRRVPHGMGRH